MANVQSMLYERTLFEQQYPAVAQRYVELAQADIVLYVPPESSYDQIISLPHYTQHVCIIIGASASIALHQELMASAQIRIYMEPYAQLCITQTCTNGPLQAQLSLNCYQQEKSDFCFKGWYTQAISAHFEFSLRGQGAHAQVQLGVRAHNDVKTSFTTMQHHQAADTSSTLLLKGLLQDTARSMHKGMIRIDASAARTKARMHSHFMLLGSGAQAYAQPSLEVLTNEVQCVHGSAIGQYDDEQLFYLGSRGVSDDAAKKLLYDAFLGDIMLPA